MAWLLCRYGATKDPTVLPRVKRRIAAMLWLHTVTGIPGYFARTAVRYPAMQPTGHNHNSSVAPGWVWEGDTSADEAAGQFFGLAAAAFVVGNATGQYDAIVETINATMYWLVKHDYFLIGWDGQPTKYAADS